MAGSQKAVAQLAAMGYMNGGMDPTLQMLTSVALLLREFRRKLGAPVAAASAAAT